MNSKRRTHRHKCAVQGCSFEPVYFHTLPTDPEIRQKWITAGNLKTEYKNIYICSNHFEDTDYEYNLKLKEDMGFAVKKPRLKNGSIPSKNLPILQHPFDTTTSSSPSIASISTAADLEINTEALDTNTTQSSCYEGLDPQGSITDFLSPTAFNVTSNRVPSTLIDHQTAIFDSSSVTPNCSNFITPQTISEASDSNTTQSPCYEDLDPQSSVMDFLPPTAFNVTSISDPSELLDQQTVVFDSSSVTPNSSNFIIPPIVSELKEMKMKYRNQMYELKFLRKENAILKKKIRKSNTKKRSRYDEELKLLEKHAEENEKKSKLNEELASIAKGMFSDNQLRILSGKRKRVRWQPSEIAQAFSLRFLSAKAYIYCRHEMKIPLPGISTLQRWAQLVDMRSGILFDVIRMIKTIGEEMSEFERLCVLMFDEMSVRSILEYDVRHDEIIGPHKKLQQVIVRGLTSKWKEIIYVGFDVNMTSTLLCEIISTLNAIGFKVVSVVSDMGSTNQGLIKELNVDHTKPYFTFPSIEWNITYIPDAPHLLKLIRNWFLDNGFTLENGKHVTKEPLMFLYYSSRSDVSSIFKLTDLHFSCNNEQRQGVSIAAELLSHTTATALAHYNKLLPQTLQETATETSKFIELVNQWFELMNTSSPQKEYEIHPPFQIPYGLKLNEQNEILNNFFTTVQNMTCIGKSSLQVFQKAIMLSIRGTQALFENVRQLNVSYILTTKINQDALECSFAKLRTKGGLDDSPTPLNALYRTRALILGKGYSPIKKNTNTRDGLEEIPLAQQAIGRVTRQPAEIDEEYDDLAGEEIEDDEIDQELVKLLDEVEKEHNSNTPEQELTNNLYGDGFRYVAGWLAMKFRKKYPELGLGMFTKDAHIEHNYPSTWIRKLSYGGLTEPSQQFTNDLMKAENMFLQMTKNIPKGKDVVKNMAMSAVSILPSIPMDILMKFMKLRLMIRMRSENQKNIELLKQRRKEREQQRKEKLQKLNVITKK